MAARTRQAEALSRTITALHRRGWCEGTGGNFSCVLRRQPLLLLMAPSGVDKGCVVPEMLIEVDADGAVVAGEGRASAETLLHLEIVQSTGAGAVLHTHSQAATLLSQAPEGRLSGPSDAQEDAAVDESGDVGIAHLTLRDLEMLKGLRGVNTHATRIEIPVLSNDQDLASLSERARPLLAAAPFGLLIAGHGLYAWGEDLREAQRHLEILEFLLEQQWRRLLLEALWERRTVPRTGH